MAQLLNRAEVSGMFEGVPVDNFTELTVELTALNITKTSNKRIWVDGELTYTIVVTNIDNRIPGMPVETVEVTDIIDPTIATLVTGSVEIDGVPATTPGNYTFDVTSGLLTVILGNIAATSSRTITFRVDSV